MPAKPTFDIDKFIEVAKNYNLRFENSTAIKGPSDACWLGVSKELGYSISAKYAYTIVKVNRYGVADTLFPDKIRESEPCEDIMISETNDDQKNTSRSSSEISEDNDDTDKTLNFNITLTRTEWDSLYDGTPQIYRRSDGKIDCRSYFSLKPYNWTSVIHEHFFEQTKLPCSMVYKHAKIYPNGQIFLNILGYCSTCKSIFTGILNNCLDENVRVIIRCTMTGQFKNCRSYRKRRICNWGEKRRIY